MNLDKGVLISKTPYLIWIFWHCGSDKSKLGSFIVIFLSSGGLHLLLVVSCVLSLCSLNLIGQNGPLRNRFYCSSIMTIKKSFFGIFMINIMYKCELKNKVVSGLSRHNHPLEILAYVEIYLRWHYYYIIDENSAVDESADDISLFSQTEGGGFYNHPLSLTLDCIFMEMKWNKGSEAVHTITFIR